MNPLIDRLIITIVEVTMLGGVLVGLCVNERLGWWRFIALPPVAAMLALMLFSIWSHP